MYGLAFLLPVHLAAAVQFTRVSPAMGTVFQMLGGVNLINCSVTVYNAI